jgi:glyoxylase-like metal-dependent hydrolase (beta-lactamase superfamily II)
MTNRLRILIPVFALLAGAVSAQDAKSVLQKASSAMGNANSIQYTGTGKAGLIGQSFTPTVDWPMVNVTTYTRTIDYGSRSSREEMTRVEQTPRPKGGGAPFTGEQKQVNLVSGQYSWNQPGNAPQPALAAADERQLQIWLTPHGFIKAAMENNTTAKNGKGGTEVTFMSGKSKVVGTITNQGMVTKVDTWLPSPVMGDMLVETMYSDYKDFSGVKFPTHIVQNQGGHPVLDLTVTDMKTNVANAALTAPDAVKNAKAPPVVAESQKLSDGVWFIGGGSHNSVVIEYPAYIAVVEAPLSEERSLAVIAEAKKLVPNKPIKYLINTHHHWDHSSGIRTYVAEGATVITSEMNKAYYEQDWKAPRTLDPDMLAKSPKKATFITVKDSYSLTDGGRTLELHLTQGDMHNAGILLGYMPKEKILIEADDFTPPAPGASLIPSQTNFGNILFDNVQRLKLDVQTIAPLHGRVVPFSEFPKALGKG